MNAAFRAVIAVAYAAVVMLFSAFAPSASVAQDDVEIIRHSMMSMFDKPETRLMVAPIVADGDHAIASWAQAETGGRALLRRKGGNWVIWLCSGDSLKSADSLQQMGVPHESASRLAKALEAGEAKLAPTIVAQFSKFDGVVMIEGGEHPPVAGHPHGGHSGH